MIESSSLTQSEQNNNNNNNYYYYNHFTALWILSRTTPGEPVPER